MLEPAQQAHKLALSRRGTDVGANFMVKDNQAGSVALILDGQVKQRGRGETRVIHFGDGVGRELHGVAGIEQHGEYAVRLATIALQIGALGAGKYVPIHVAKIVAGRVRAIFREFLAESEIRRAVKAGDETVNDSLRHQVQTGNSGEHGRIEETLQHLFSQAFAGGGMWSSSRRRISSESMRSDSAWKFKRMRWRSTGVASAVMSSYAT